MLPNNLRHLYVNLSNNVLGHNANTFKYLGYGFK